MARRTGPKTSRAPGPSSRPTAIPSTYTTPSASALPSAYASEAEHDPDANIDVSTLNIGALTLADPRDGTVDSDKKKKAVSLKPFRFMDLPSELRIKVYAYHFADAPRTIDLDPDNYKRIHRYMSIFRVSRTVFSEASYVLYSSRTIRLFPTHPGRFFKTKKPLLARLNPRQRACLTSLELRLGPGWSKPPRGWVVNRALGLADCVNVRRLTVFIECDPSDSVFTGFRQSDTFYEDFSSNLLTEVLAQMPWVDRVYFDAWSSVKKKGGMMRRLVGTSMELGKKVCWGPERGWTDRDEVEIMGTLPGTDLSTIGVNVMVVQYA